MLKYPSPYRVSALLWTVVLAVAGCSGDSSSTPAAAKTTGDASQKPAVEKQKLTLAVIPKCTGGEFWETVELGARDAGKDLGVEIKWEGALAETDLAEQNKIIENMLNLGVDGMAIAPLNPRVMRKPVANVVAAGIPVVIFDSSVDGDAHVSYVATDNTAGGALAAKYLVEQLADSKKRLFLLRYIQGTASTEQRSQGFLDTAKAAGFDVLADPYSDDSTVAGSIKTTANTLEHFVKEGKLELDGMFAANLTSTQGLLAALDDLRQSGVKVDVVVVGFDTSPKLLDELRAGKVNALVSQDPRRMGYLAVETLVKHLRGEQVAPRIDTGLELVTSDRLEKEPAIRQRVGLE
jgi:ribose transport system substrate-binding protein